MRMSLWRAGPSGDGGGSRTARWVAAGASAVAAALFAGTVASELRKPAAERTWRGRVLGVPYDLRLPTPARVLAGLWAPEDPRWVIERGPCGLGWSLNLARLVRHQPWAPMPTTASPSGQP